MPRGLGPRGFLTDEEKKNRPKVTKFLLLRILSYLLPYWPQFLLVFVAILLSATVGLLPSIITGRIVDEALLGKDMALLIRLLLLAFVTLAASQVIGVLESYINAWISQRIIYDMKNQMYDHLLHMPHAFFTSEKQGDIITRMNTDTKEMSLLEDICFTVPAGKMYALVGPSGSGKSTVVNLIPRLFDVTGGRVTVAGTDVRDFDLTWLRQNIGVVSQDTYLFNGTIRENLLYARENATQAELERACRVASIHDFIAGQPEGYDTVVGNRGLKLSGGEKQRISIARVVLKDPKILILDEATSALDSISENAIQDALETLMEGRTSIVIAHRLSTILKADRILVISGGVITESGDHETLLAQNGIYRELYETQFRKVLEYEAEAHPL